jgi:TRAP-type C4-dicarboxylate transport system permease small subunit
MEAKVEGDGQGLRGLIVKRFWKWFDRINDVMAGLAGLILVFICAAVCYSIGMRFLFRQTTIWIMQTTEYALLWILFLSTTWLLREGGHITTDIIHSHLSERTKRYLDFIMFTLAGFACVVMVYFGFDYIGECMSRSVNDVRAVTIPKWPVFVIIPIGSLLLCVQLFRMAWSRMTENGVGK